MSLAIIDTGCANLASVGFAFGRMGVHYIITQDAQKIKNAGHVILPGVGAAGYAMEQLRARGLVATIQNLQQPLMGICLGMQLLFEKSEERGAQCLGLIKGEASLMNTGDLPAPHMGWNTLENLESDPLLDGIDAGDYAYFVHSYAVPKGDYTLACSSYGEDFSAIIKQGNVYGCQFHPERSSKVGARILANFLKVKS